MEGVDISNIKTKVLSGIFWKLMERVGTQGIQFVIQIILARLLAPEDYGVIALITIFIAVANIFVQSGFNTALIQRKEADEADFSSVFYLSLFVAGIMYMILFFASPFIANFYGIPQLKLILRILLITLFFGAVNSIQNAIVSKKMQFKKQFFSSLGAILVSGLFGIVLAYLGFGVWALIIQQIVNQFFITIILWFTVKWRPRLIFSFIRVRRLFSYSWKILASSLIDIFYGNLYNIIIGKLYSPEILGFFNRGDQFSAVIVSNINGSIQSVMLPALTSYQDDRQRVKEIVRRSIVTSSFILFPIMIGLAVIAEPLVKILLTDKWLPCVPFLQIFCVNYALWPIHTANLQAINALGRSDIFLKLEIIKNMIGIAILGITISQGVYVITIGLLIDGIITSFINAYPNLRLLNYSYKEQWKDIMPSLLLSLVMGGVIYSFRWFYIKNTFLLLIVQVCIGSVAYITMAMCFKLECYTYLLKTLKDILNNRRNMQQNEIRNNAMILFNKSTNHKYDDI